MKSNSFTTFLTLFLGIVLGAGSYGWINWQISQPSVDAIMADFQTARGRTEDRLMDPLILHGDRVKARVIEEIKNPTMEKRRYAILFLGNESIPDALPVLREILLNEAERDIFRGDALTAIWQIDRQEGLERAATFQKRSGYLGQIATQLIAAKHAPYQTSYWQAFTRERK